MAISCIIFLSVSTVASARFLVGGDFEWTIPRTPSLLQFASKNGSNILSSTLAQGGSKNLSSTLAQGGSKNLSSTLAQWQGNVLRRYNAMNCTKRAWYSLPTKAAESGGRCQWHKNVSNQPAPSHFLTHVPTFYVSLGGDVEREWLENFSLFSSNLNIVQGVIGTDVQAVERAVTRPYDELMRSSWLSERPGVLGCTVSHLKAIKTANDSGVPFALILESDSLPDLAPWWTNSLEEYASSLPPDWEASQLAWTTEPHVASYKYRERSTTSPYIRQTSYGTVAYLIHRRGMQKILSQLWDTKANKFNWTRLASDCTYPTADDCLLSFSPYEAGRGNLLNVEHIYAASPPLFTSFRRYSEVQVESKEWVTASFCDDISSALLYVYESSACRIKG
eukprot:TRINITY_DN1975_c0_g1_i1.p1 TRINITY_DN1975_c0_g1~~TRINITY_DN1975_c0_g1_i1.p1  ORF type:complete len:392 (+),score=37.57 TRINITY_DN1975_c0_g1_i1:88-1263(+)